MVVSVRDQSVNLEINSPALRTYDGYGYPLFTKNELDMPRHLAGGASDSDELLLSEQDRRATYRMIRSNA